MSEANNTYAIVVIGRNEGNRLVKCFKSIEHHLPFIIYVDSGSKDNSVKYAKEIKATVVELDDKIPFTAARARNEGFSKAISLWPTIEYVQFLDGDCELKSVWIQDALMEFSKHQDCAVICGQLTEKYPHKSIYNQFCDIEWKKPYGFTDSCGGIAIYRVNAFKMQKGFNPNLIAGEEPDLCFRIRRDGWKILQLENQMAVHDANMLHWKQWAKRTIRSGYAYASGYWLNKKKDGKYYLKNNLSIATYGFFIPLILFVLSCTGYLALALSLFILIELNLMRRIYLSIKMRTNTRSIAIKFSVFTSLGKFYEFIGQCKFIYNEIIKNDKALLIEHK